MQHTLEVTVAWGDCDPAGFVFYPRYFAWFDRSTHALLTAHGLDHRTITERHGAIGFSLVDAQASFKAPATYGDAIRVVSTITKVGTSSLTVSHEIHGDGLLVEGQEVRVWVVRDGEAIRGAAIPEAVRRALAAS